MTTQTALDAIKSKVMNHPGCDETFFFCQKAKQIQINETKRQTLNNAMNNNDKIDSQDHLTHLNMFIIPHKQHRGLQSTNHYCE